MALVQEHLLQLMTGETEPKLNVRVGDNREEEEWPTYLNNRQELMSLSPNGFSKLDWVALAMDALMREAGFCRKEPPFRVAETVAYNYALFDIKKIGCCTGCELLVFSVGVTAIAKGKIELFQF